MTRSAGLIFLLVSADFVASDYCYEIEMKTALQRHDKGEARVVPLIVRDCQWRKSPFGKLQALPKDGKPVTSWPNRDEVLRHVADSIEQMIEVLCKPSHV